MTRPATVMRRIPIALVLTRLCLGPVVVITAVLPPNATAFAACLIFAFVSDYFDGVIARRLGVATPTLRRLDSAADTVFYAGVAIAAAITAMELLRPHLVALAALGLVEVARYVYDLRKFGKEASYHMWSSKLWGVLLFLAVYSLLVLHRGGWIVGLAIYWGILADLEGLAISMTLKEWRADVPTLRHARLLASMPAD